jgi:hypothetical protein
MCQFPKGVGDIYTALDDAAVLQRLQAMGAVQESPLVCYIPLDVPLTQEQQQACVQPDIRNPYAAAVVFHLSEGSWVGDGDLYLRGENGKKIPLCAEMQSPKQRAELSHTVHRLMQRLS